MIYKLYYVYGIDGNIANSFGVKQNLSSDNYILINGKRYIPCYENIKAINIKLDPYEVLGVASEEEMDKIKGARKSYKKVKEQNSYKKRKKPNNNNGKSEILVCLKKDKACRYIVCIEYPNIYTTISVSALLSNHEIKFCNLFKYEVEPVTNMASEELEIIRENLAACDDKCLPKELVKRIKANKL